MNLKTLKTELKFDVEDNYLTPMLADEIYARAEKMVSLYGHFDYEKLDMQYYYDESRRR